MRVAMVVADEIMIRRQVSEIVTGYGCERIVEADGVAEAIALAEREKPLLVLIDLSMPGGIDGVAAAKEIFQKNPVPIVMLTGDTDAKRVEAARLAGVMSYVLKPVHPAQLYAAIDMALHLFREISNLREEVSSLRQMLETRKLIERAKAILIARGMTEPAAYRKMQQTSMQKRRHMREVAEAILLMEG